MSCPLVTASVVLFFGTLVFGLGPLCRAGQQPTKQKSPPSQRKAQTVKQSKVPSTSSTSAKELAENIPSLFIEGKAPWVRSSRGGGRSNHVFFGRRR